MKQYLEIGRIINKRGIAGELKVECYCDSPSSAKKIKVLYTDENAAQRYDVVSIKDYKGFLYIKLSGVNSVEDADLLRGKYLYADRNDIDVEDGSYFIADLIGLDVVDADSGKIYGKVKDVVNYGASDIYVISDGRNEYMLPDTKEMIVQIDLDGKILVRAISGIFDDAEEIR